MMNMPAEPFKLSKEEISSALWKKLNAHFTSRLDVMRKQNDVRKSEEDTAFLRGSIAVTKELLALGQE